MILPAPTEDELELWNSDQKINAILAYRRRTGAGLLESKHLFADSVRYKPDMNNEAVAMARVSGIQDIQQDACMGECKILARGIQKRNAAMQRVLDILATPANNTQEYNIKIGRARDILIDALGL